MSGVRPIAVSAHVDYLSASSRAKTADEPPPLVKSAALFRQKLTCPRPFLPTLN